MYTSIWKSLASFGLLFRSINLIYNVYLFFPLAVETPTNVTSLSVCTLSPYIINAVSINSTQMVEFGQTAWEFTVQAKLEIERRWQLNSKIVVVIHFIWWFSMIWLIIVVVTTTSTGTTSAANRKHERFWLQIVANSGASGKHSHHQHLNEDHMANFRRPTNVDVTTIVWREWK